MQRHRETNERVDLIVVWYNKDKIDGTGSGIRK